MSKCWKFGKWSWHFEKCLRCGENKMTHPTRHKGHGLCIRCFDRNRDKKPARKIIKRRSGRKFYDKFKSQPNYKEIVNAKMREYIKTHPKIHKKLWKKRNLKKSFTNFIILKNKNKTRKGVEITIDGERVKTPIKSPKGNAVDMDRFVSQCQLFREVYTNLLTL